MDEVGIYRISGVTSEIQRIKRAFDKSKCIHLFLLNYIRDPSRNTEFEKSFIKESVVIQ